MIEQTESTESKEVYSLTQIVIEGLAHLDPVDWIDRRIGVWMHRPWAKLLKSYDVLGLLQEIIQTATANSAWRFQISRHEGLSGWEVEQLLKKYGIIIWGRGFDVDSIYFNVKAEQANWAEYLLKRRGLTIFTAPYNPLNDLYPARHPQGSMPISWNQRKRGGKTKNSDVPRDAESRGSTQVGQNSARFPDG